MNREKIFLTVNEIFREIFDDPELSVTDKTDANDIEDWDSLEQINLLVAMEKKFLIKFSVDDVENLQNVGETVDLIIRKIEEKGDEQL
ncbi:MAG: acyl carrier protein [Ruminococcaceae bacterium]|nr:acyl carrier protein [Oscillospiraceae bacterium]